MNYFRRMVVILIGAILISVGVNAFILPYSIIDGGMIGVALVLSYQWNIDTGFAFILLSIPIFIIVWKYHKQYCINSFIGMLVTGVLMDLLSFTGTGAINNPLFSSILGGLFVGLGIGLLFLCDMSTDSIDLLAQFLSSLFNLNVGIIVFLFDLIVIISALPFLNKDQTILSFITITTNCFIVTLVVSRTITFSSKI